MLATCALPASIPAATAPASLSKRALIAGTAASLTLGSPVSTQAMKRIDAHVHIWAPKELSNVYPYSVSTSVPTLAAHRTFVRNATSQL